MHSPRGVSPSRAGSSLADVHTTEPAPAPVQQQRLTTPDLEFDYDRSQLRDPRPTPGRVKRPRYNEYDLSESERKKFRPPPLPKPKGRLSASQEDKRYEEEACRDPIHLQHDMYVCLRKGRAGSPTYDTAGFELDYNKVRRSLAPQAYSRSRIVSGMQKAIALEEKFDDRMIRMFFEDHEVELALEKQRSMPLIFRNCIKDKISKDLGIPWHKIKMAELDLWEQKGFPKEKVADWTAFTKEDKKRNLKMVKGASFRK